jgi:hypothetical protein
MAPHLPGYRPTHHQTVPVLDGAGHYQDHTAHHYARVQADGALFACLIGTRQGEQRGIAYGSTSDDALRVARHRAARWHAPVNPGCPACTRTTLEMLEEAEAAAGRAQEAATAFRGACEEIRQIAAENQPAIDALEERIRRELGRGYRLTSGVAPAQQAA